MDKQQMIEAILSKDIDSLRRIKGKLNGVPVLCHIGNNGELKTFDIQGNVLNLDYPRDFSIKDWFKFLTKFNVIHFADMEKLREFIASGRTIPIHEVKGLPPWVWLVKDSNEYLKWEE